MVFCTCVLECMINAGELHFFKLHMLKISVARSNAYYDYDVNGKKWMMILCIECKSVYSTYLQNGRNSDFKHHPCKITQYLYKYNNTILVQIQ